MNEAESMPEVFHIVDFRYNTTNVLQNKKNTPS